MRKIFLAAAALLALGAGAFAQGRKAMSPPTIMIIPDDIYCNEHGYVVEFNDQGKKATRPDYGKALSTDADLQGILTQIASLIQERSSTIEIIDINSAINSSNMTEVLGMSNGGDESESIDEMIIRNANADFLVKVNFHEIKNGPFSQMQITLVGVDAYTGMQVAPVEGISQQTSSASTAVLAREAVFSKMDGFLEKMLTYYSNMIEGGRCAAFEFKTLDGSAYTMNSNITINLDGKAEKMKLREAIDELLYLNSVDGKGLEKVRSGRTFLSYSSVYIPLFATVRGRERKQSATMVIDRIASELSNAGVECETKAIGLGKVYIYIK